jgi:2-polyprenyl-3-methyl-5-hydroxy-6-metoxy-1,4-benzoquinol methylase
MSDEDYLVEEEGRRRTARRLLDLLAKHVPSGRLLEVGCGHGLLLDEARRRGYDAEGLELSVDAARHARDALGLTVRETVLEDTALDGECYDAVLLIDVLEHLDDPVAALKRAGSLLAAGGALLIVTPDPSSLTARVAGALLPDTPRDPPRADPRTGTGDRRGRPPRALVHTRVLACRVRRARWPRWGRDRANRRAVAPHRVVVGLARR